MGSRQDPYAYAKGDCETVLNMSDQDYKIYVDGMTCTNCSLSVRKKLEKSGYSKVSVNLSNGETRFSSAESVDLDHICESIDKLGFAARKAEEKAEKGNPLLKRFLICLPFTLVLLLHMFLPMDHWLNNAWLQFILASPVMAIGWIQFGKGAISSIKNKMANMDVLILSGASAAYIYSIYGSFFISGNNHQYLFFETAATIITLVLVGNLIEHFSVKKTGSAIDALKNIQAKEAKVEVDGTISVIPLEKVKSGDIILVNNGDHIPCDGEVLEGTGSIDESMITGESLPIFKESGHTVMSGTLVSEGNFRLRVSKIGKDSTLSKIIRLMEDAQTERAPIQALADKVSGIFVPVVLSLAILSFVLNYWILNLPLEDSIMRSIAVLVISCPCALGLATPTAVVVGIGKAAKAGILIRSAKVLETFAKIKYIIFDKTGTLTNGKFVIEKMDILKYDKAKISSIVYTMEQHSSHPLAKALSGLLSESEPVESLKDFREQKGIGVFASDSDGNSYAIGSFRLLKEVQESDREYHIFLMENENCIARIQLKDDIKANAHEMIQYMHSAQVESTVLSGDQLDKVTALSKHLGIQNYQAELSPEDKLSYIKEYKTKGVTAMVGDGINDAPALSLSDVAISFKQATDIAMHSADIVLLQENELNNLVEAHHISKLTLKTIRQNLFWAFSYNIVAIPMAAMGMIEPMAAALFMAFSDVVVVGNSLLLKIKK